MEGTDEQPTKILEKVVSILHFIFHTRGLFLRDPVERRPPMRLAPSPFSAGFFARFAAVASHAFRWRKNIEQQDERMRIAQTVALGERPRAEAA